jgi:hypothetical protein
MAHVEGVMTGTGADITCGTVHCAAPVAQARCAAAARAAEDSAADREQLERKVARLEKAKETEAKGAT